MAIISFLIIFIPNAYATSDFIIDMDGIKTSGRGSTEDINVTDGDPLTRWPTDAPPMGERAGIDWFDIDNSLTWTLGDDLMSEDPDTCPTSDRNAEFDHGKDCPILDLDGHLNMTDGLVVDCDLETGVSPSGKWEGNCADPKLTFFDSDGDGFWDDGEDIILDENEDMIFDEEEIGMIKIVKEKFEEDDPSGFFGFNSNIPGWEIFDLATGEMTPKVNVTTGIYNVTETDLLPMWVLHNATCDDGSTINEINITADEFVTCTFVNDFEMNPGLWVENIVNGIPDGDFDFELNEEPFTIVTVDGMGSEHFDDLPPGEYDIVELNEEFTTSASCEDQDGADKGDPRDGPITLEKDEMVICTFTNEGGFIKIIKEKFEEEDPNSGLEDFDFETDLPVDDFSLKLGEMTDPILVPLDTPFTVNEIEDFNPPMWTLVNTECSGDNTVDSIIVSTPGSTVTCTFFNDFLADSGLWIFKEVGFGLPDGVYNFTLSGDDFDPTEFSIVTEEKSGSFHIESLPAGTYEILEVEDENLVSATCSNGDEPSEVTLESEEMVECTFVNTRIDDDMVGGEFLNISNTSLLLAGLNSIGFWFIPTLIVTGAVVYRIKLKNNKN